MKDDSVKDIKKRNKICILENELDKASRIEVKDIASKIMSIGYKCRRCARCCKHDFGDNTVSVFPFEIKHIEEKTGLKRKDIAVPAPSDDRDPEGNIHTFEWVLKKNGDCAFLEKALCKIYKCRPFICSTYPFYLLEGNMMFSECEGIGGQIEIDEAMKIAGLLKERYLREIMESISLIEKFDGFRPGGAGNTCVHDSEGEHWLP